MLDSAGITPSVCNQPEWTRFMSLYGDVISDVPLTITRLREITTARTKIDIPTYIDSVTVQKHDLDPANHVGAAFELQWNLRFASEPERYKMTGWRMGFHPNE